MRSLAAVGKRYRRAWHRLSTATKLLIVLNISAVLLIAALLGFATTFVSQRMHTSVDDDLVHHLDALRTILSRELVSLQDQAQMLVDLYDAGQLPLDQDATHKRSEVLSSHMHRATDGVVVLDAAGEIVMTTGVPPPPFPPEFAADALRFSPGPRRASLARLADGALWLIGAAPYVGANRTAELLFVVIRRLNHLDIVALHNELGSHVVFSDGHTTASSFAADPLGRFLSGEMQNLAWLAEDSEPLSRNVDIGESPFRIRLGVLQQEPDGFIAAGVMQSARTANTLVRQMVLEIVLLGLILGAVNFVLTYYLIHRVFRPLESLRVAAETMSKGDLRPVTAIRGSVEVDVLYDAFDHMREQIQNLIKEQQSWNEHLEEKVRERTQELQRLFRQHDRLLVKLISAQEEEQRRVARELHDDTSQALATLIVTLGVVARTTKEERTHQYLQDVKEQIVDALENVKRIIRDLRPRLLDDLGLQSAVQLYLTERSSTNGLQGSFQVVGEEKRLDPHVETGLFRVIQEALNNVWRHSGATRAWVNLCWHPDALTIEIIDNGQGFCVNGQLKGSGSSTGFGLLGMRERMDLLGGTISLHSELGHGTTVHVDLPIPQEDRSE